MGCPLNSLIVGNSYKYMIRSFLIILSLFFAPIIFAQTSKSRNSAIHENRIIDTIAKLKGVTERANYVKDQTNGKRHLHFAIWEKPKRKTPYYWVKVMEDNGDAYVKHFNFYVYLKTMTIKYLDTMTDEVLDLNMWRKRENN